jgi:hypothetical protein
MPLPRSSSRATTRSATGPGRRQPRRWAIGATLAVLLGLLGSVAGAAVTVGPGASAAGAAAPKKISAYWLVASDGGVFSFGGAGFFGSTGNIHLNRPVVAMTGTADSDGYWLVASDGGVFAFGDAAFHGSTGGMVLNKPVVGMTTTPDGGGYWMVASDGGVFAFGDALFYGSMGGHPLNRPVVGMAATPDGQGYWLVASDGGIFSFGDAHFYGSTGNLRLNKPIVGMTTAPGGRGYWFTASDGGVFAFGDAPFYGSLGNVPQSRPIVAITADRKGNGYWFTNTNGAVTAFGGATYWGSAPQVLNNPVVGMAEAGASGHFTGSSYPSGSFGYDISNFQCGNLPPSPHTIGLVEVVGESNGSTNACLQNEAAWAAGGLNLYIYLTYGQSPSSGDPACQTTASPAACNFGFEAALDAFDKAAAAGVNTSVGWWLDVEPDTPGVPSWSPSLGANAAVVKGAIDGLHYKGLNGVGIYASPGAWTGIVGTDYSPAVPYWAADWDINPATTCGNVHSIYSGLPSGPVQIVQYSSPSFPYADGGMSTAFDDDYGC